MVTEGAIILAVSRKAQSDLITGHARVSPIMAIRFDRAFGGGAGTLLRV